MINLDFLIKSYNEVSVCHIYANNRHLTFDYRFRLVMVIRANANRLVFQLGRTNIDVMHDPSLLFALMRSKCSARIPKMLSNA